MSRFPINYQRWAENMIAFIRESGLENEFKDWCGGFPYPVAPEKFYPLETKTEKEAP